MKKIMPIILFAFVTTFAIAQKNKQANEVRIPMKAESWEFKGTNAKFVDHKGVPSIQSGNDIVIAKNIEFTNGTIEFDVEATSGFVSIYFHHQSDDETEIFYLRGVESPPTSLDAVQYAPIIKKVNMWDMYPDYQTAAYFRKDEWTHIKLVVSGMQMLVYVNSKTPTLQIPRLEGDTKNGGIAFQGDCFINNIVIKPNEVEGLNPTEGFDPTYHDVRYIKNWQISEPVPLPQGQELSNNNMPDIQTKWQPIAAERKGMVNITRLYGQSSSRRYVWLRSKIISKTSRKVKLDFGFSDEVWVFLNDRTTFVDKNLYGQGMRKKPDGRLSKDNASFEVQLKEGENDLVIGIANDFYGWGIIARLDDLEGITLSTDYKIETINKDFEKHFGTYASKDIPIKLKVSQRDNKLSVLPTAEGPILFEPGADNVFTNAEIKLTVEFSIPEKKLTLKTPTQTFIFFKE